MNPYKEYKYHYVYKTTNTINGKIYIGVHCCNILENTYLGSGVLLKPAIKKYGRDNFTKEILHICDSYEDALDIERSLVNIDFVKDRLTYNMEIGGRGGKYWTGELIEKMSITQKQRYKNGARNWNCGLTKDTDDRLLEISKKLSAANKGKFTGKNNPMYGKSTTDLMTPDKISEWKANIKKSNTGKKRTEDQKTNYSNYAKTRFWIVNNVNTLKHCTDINDQRILSGEFQVGRKWKNSDEPRTTS